ncbi:hypothetical protein C8A05DRAFT_32520, partial [Staphylotrichum tortipilum]
MSTIASPRDPSAPFPRRANSAIITPTSSSRPSLDVPASASASPNPNASSSSSTPSNTTANPSSQPQSKRANRAALREYYNLRASGKPLPSPPTVEITDPGAPPLSPGGTGGPSPTAPSELDAPTFAAGPYLARLLASASLAELLRTQGRLLAEMRALDAEKKALVYDNY